MSDWLAYPIGPDGKVIEGAEPLRFSMNPGHAEPHQVADFFCALSDLQKAHGGYGLRFVAEEENDEPTVSPPKGESLD